MTRGVSDLAAVNASASQSTLVAHDAISPDLLPIGGEPAIFDTTRDFARRLGQPEGNVATELAPRSDGRDPLNDTKANDMAAPQRDMAHVLVVEDDPKTRSLVSIVLRHVGYQVTEAAGVREGLGVMRQCIPDAVLTDLQLPDGSGHEILKHAGTLPTVPPVIVMSGTFDGRTEPELLAAGAAALLPKPFLLHELIATVHDATDGWPATSLSSSGLETFG